MIDISAAVSAAIRAEDERLEALCWEMLAHGNCGIAVIEHPVEFDFGDATDLGANQYRMSATHRIEMRLDPEVPRMQIFRFPSHEAYDLWIENGKPE